MLATFLAYMERLLDRLRLRQTYYGRTADDLAVFVATGFGSGYGPWAPGTVGTLVAVPFALLLASGGVAFHALATVLVTVAAVPLCSRAEASLNERDPGSIVLDEMCGYFWVTLFIPVELWWWILGFVLFRVLDIAKPGWIGASQKLPRGLGIVVDDLLAGVGAGLVLWVLARLF